MYSQSSSILILFIFSIGVSEMNASKILVISGSATSHCLEVMAITDELLKRGHNITFYSLVYDPKICVSKVDTELYKNTFSIVAPKVDQSLKEARKDFLTTLTSYIFERKSLLSFLWQHGFKMIQKDCDVAVDLKVIEDLKKENYDFTVTHGTAMMGCFFAIPYLLDVPVAAVGPLIDFEESKMPFQTNTFPHLSTAYSNEMTFIQRFINTLVYFVHPFIKRSMIPSIDLSKYSQKLSEYSTVDLGKIAVLHLENSDYIVDYPKAIFPNFVQVGGLTSEPAKPLPTDLQKVMDETKEGTVLVAFGSILRGMPADLKEKLMAVFVKLDHQVLFKEDEEEVQGNVRVLKWVPQNDVLGHPKTKLFISHCGRNGFWESVYHGVPIICMPTNIETEFTVTKIEKHGIGSSINIFDYSVKDLVETINVVLRNDSISRNMKRMSTLLRARPETPRQRAASAIEHVINYGGAHMQPPSVDFGYLSYSCLDIWIAIFACALVIIAFDIWIIWICCCRGKGGKSKTD